MNKKEKSSTKDKYTLETNENQKNYIKKLAEDGLEINIFFDDKKDTDVMSGILKQLSKYYIEEILDIQM